MRQKEQPGTLQVTVPYTGTAAAGTDQDLPVFVAPNNIKVTGVSYTPRAAMTGHDVNNAFLKLINKGTDGLGATVVAEKEYNAGVDMVAFDENTITLSGTAANLNVAAGDVLDLRDEQDGAGLVVPPGILTIQYVNR